MQASVITYVMYSTFLDDNFSRISGETRARVRLNVVGAYAEQPTACKHFHEEKSCTRYLLKVADNRHLPC